MHDRPGSAVPDSIIFWKWADRDLEPGAALEQIDDLCRRSNFDLVAVGLEHTSSSFDSDRAHAALAAASARLVEHGRRLVLSIDPRQEPHWHVHMPDHCLAWVDSLDTALDEPGGTAWTSEMAIVHDHFGVHAPVHSELLAAFAYDDGDPDRVPTRIDTEVTVVDDATPGRLEIGLPHRAGNRVLAFVAHWLSYPDVFADAVFERHLALLDRYVDVPLAGAAIDEWGTVPQPAFVFDRAWATPWWSAGLAAAYAAATGRDLLADLFRQQIAGRHAAEQTRAITDYYRVLRDRTAAFEALHYEATKARFGPDSYVGFHPTWWAVDERNQAREVWKNGFNWWSVRRDVGQTDEVAPIGVRLALARKAGHPHFFNMWYSMSTHDVATYVQDAWRNARYGGRTNHLGYRCEAERWGVLELADGGLEQVSAMEDRIKQMAEHVRSLVDAQVLVVAGWDAAVDWRRHVGPDGRWDFHNDTLSRAYAVLRALWDAGFIAELVPSYEHLEVVDGAVSWCGHRYEAALFVDATPPPGATGAAVVSGAADGGEDVAAIAARLGAQLNDVPWGCRLEDGTVLMAAPGESLDPIVDLDFSQGTPPASRQAPTALVPIGNRIAATVEVDGHQVVVDAEDFVVIAPGLAHVAAGVLHRLTVDGDDVTHRWQAVAPT